jgi:competence protein ComEC
MNKMFGEDFKMSSFRFKLWDVEHGLSMWIQTPNGQNHWIDLGKTESFSPSEHVKAMYGVNSIDHLIISHPDKDHLEDLPNFIVNFGDPIALSRNRKLPEKEKYGSLEYDYQEIYKRLDTSFTKDVTEENDPRRPEVNGGLEYCIRYNRYSGDNKPNNTSVVIAILYNGLLLFCPGDIEPDGWDILHNNSGADFEELINRASIRVLVAPHHGRKSGYSEHMMDFVNPNLVIISDVWGDSETHPQFREKPLGISQNGQTLKYFSTKRNGRVEITESSSGGFEFHQFE